MNPIDDPVNPVNPADRVRFARGRLIYIYIYSPLWNCFSLESRTNPHKRLLPMLAEGLLVTLTLRTWLSPSHFVTFLCYCASIRMTWVWQSDRTVSCR